MSKDGLILENMDLSDIHLDVRLSFIAQLMILKAVPVLFLSDLQEY